MKTTKNIIFLFFTSLFMVRATINIFSEMTVIYIIGVTIFSFPICGYLIGKSNGFLENTCLAITISCILYFDSNFPFDRIYNWIPMIGMMIMLFVGLLMGFGVKLSSRSEFDKEISSFGYTDNYHCDPIKTNAAPNATSDYGVNGMLNTYNNRGV